jgi:hypothetical protein
VTAIHYRVVFEINQKGYDWRFPAVGVLFLIAGAILVWMGRRQKLARFRNTGYVFVGFASLWTLLVFSTTFRDYLALQRAYRKGQYSVVEGRVEDFRPMPYDGHQEECFSVEHVTFCYSDFEPTGGFNNTASHGGPLRPGLPIRVAYVDNHILRLEVEETDKYQ